MTITLSFGNFLLLILTITLAVTSVYLIISLRRITKFVEKAETLIPEAKDVLSKSKDVLKRAESLLEESEETVKEAKNATARVRWVIEETSNIIEDALFVFKPISAISQAFRTGYSLIHRFFVKDEEDKEE